MTPWWATTAWNSVGSATIAASGARGKISADEIVPPTIRGAWGNAPAKHCVTGRRAFAECGFAQKVILWEASLTPIYRSVTLWHLWQSTIAVRDRSHRLSVQSCRMPCFRAAQRSVSMPTQTTACQPSYSSN
jgi:hypothetical protein